jgi:PAS domain S-box-containing protein
MTGPDPNLFKLMAERVTDYAIFLLDPLGLILSWNPGAAAIKQYRESDVIGKHFSIFYTPADIARGWPAFELERATLDGRFEDEGWRVRKDGSRFWANVIITALRDDTGTLLAFSKITRDLTARKMQEEGLRQSEERFRLLVDGVQDYAIYMLSPEGMITSWNVGARRIKGYEGAEIIGKHYSCFYTDDDVELGKPWSELAVAKEHGRAEEEGWRVRKDGSRFWARVVVTSLYDSSGALRGFAKVTQDLTQRRHAEALEISTGNLNDFIAVLAHELRNPLAPIRNAVQLQKLLPPGDPGREATRLVIERQSAQLSRIVDDLLDISRITRGAMPLNLEPMDLCAVVQHAVETARPAIEAGQHTLELEMADEPLRVSGDALRLDQVLSNLLSNAARYTPPGGHITVKAYRARADGHMHACVSVRDTGQGIDPSMLKAIFGMFVQGKDSLKRPIGGLGVGLALARSIVELHHGVVEVNSEGLGKGAEFVVRMPLMSEVDQALGMSRMRGTQMPAEGPVLTAVNDGNGRRVLVVDDNVDAAVVLMGLLERHGYKALAVHDGATALNQAEGFRPDVVLLDIGMPGMNGLEVARRLRERNGIPRPFIVAVTGWGKEEDETRSRDAGFDVHLVKPVEELKLLEVLGAQARVLN